MYLHEGPAEGGAGASAPFPSVASPPPFGFPPPRQPQGISQNLSYKMHGNDHPQIRQEEESPPHGFLEVDARLREAGGEIMRKYSSSQRAMEVNPHVVVQRKGRGFEGQDKKTETQHPPFEPMEQGVLARGPRPAQFRSMEQANRPTKRQPAEQPKIQPPSGGGRPPVKQQAGGKRNGEQKATSHEGPRRIIAMTLPERDKKKRKETDFIIHDYKPKEKKSTSPSNLPTPASQTKKRSANETAQPPPKKKESAADFEVLSFEMILKRKAERGKGEASGPASPSKPPVETPKPEPAKSVAPAPQPVATTKVAEPPQDTVKEEEKDLEEGFEEYGYGDEGEGGNYDVGDEEADDLAEWEEYAEEA